MTGASRRSPRANQASAILFPEVESAEQAAFKTRASTNVGKLPLDGLAQPLGCVGCHECSLSKMSGTSIKSASLAAEPRPTPSCSDWLTSPGTKHRIFAPAQAGAPAGDATTSLNMIPRGRPEGRSAPRRSSMSPRRRLFGSPRAKPIKSADHLGRTRPNETPSPAAGWSNNRRSTV